MNKIVGLLLLCVYLFFVILLTVYLFMYSRLADPSNLKIIVFPNNNVEIFKKGSLIVTKNNKKSLKVGDDVLFHNFYTLERSIMHQKIASIEEINESETMYELNNGRFLSSSYLIGRTNDSIEIPMVGYVFNILSSTVGYLLFVLLPTISLFIYELNNIFKISKA